MSQHQTTDEGVNEQISKEAIWVSGEDRNLAVLRHRVACTHPLPNTATPRPSSPCREPGTTPSPLNAGKDSKQCLKRREE